MGTEAGQLLCVDLLFNTAPRIQPQVLLPELEKACPGIKWIGGLQFMHPPRPEYGVVPPQIFLFPGHRPNDKKTSEDALQQSWNLPDAAEVVRALPHKVAVQEAMALGLPPKLRVTFFLDALEAIVARLGCEAIHWRTSQQITSAAYFLEAMNDSARHMLTSGPLNVRYFRTNPDRPDEGLADTMGLSAAFGLPDVQCHFHTMGMNQVFPPLHSTAVYLFENGPVIKSGDTIPGADGGNWRCRYENSLADPPRPVLDVNPGPKYAVGDRE